MNSAVAARISNRVPEQEVPAGQADELAVRDPARHLTPASQLVWIVDAW